MSHEVAASLPDCRRGMRVRHRQMVSKHQQQHVIVVVAQEHHRGKHKGHGKGGHGGGSKFVKRHHEIVDACPSVQTAGIKNLVHGCVDGGARSKRTGRGQNTASDACIR